MTALAVTPNVKAQETYMKLVIATILFVTFPSMKFQINHGRYRCALTLTAASLGMLLDF